MTTCNQLYAKALEYLTGWRRCSIELERVQKQNAALLKVVGRLEHLIDCETLHHVPSDRHKSGEPCPVEARLRERVRKAKGEA